MRSRRRNDARNPESSARDPSEGFDCCRASAKRQHKINQNETGPSECNELNEHLVINLREKEEHVGGELVCMKVTMIETYQGKKDVTVRVSWRPSAAWSSTTFWANSCVKKISANSSQ